MSIYKGQIEGFPQKIVEKMLEYQVEQGHPKDISVFEYHKGSGTSGKGFFWQNTPEGNEWWTKIIVNNDYDLFFEKYPSKEIISYKLKEDSNIQQAYYGITNRGIKTDPKVGDIKYNDTYYHKFKSLGVLDLWFDPVYKEEKPKFSVMKMRDSETGFMLTISKEGILYEKEQIWLSIEGVRMMKKLFISELNYRRTGKDFNRDYYVVRPTRINVGCKKDTFVEDWIKVLEIYDSYRK